MRIFIKSIPPNLSQPFAYPYTLLGLIVAMEYNVVRQFNNKMMGMVENK